MNCKEQKYISVCILLRLLQRISKHEQSWAPGDPGWKVFLRGLGSVWICSHLIPKSQSRPQQLQKLLRASERTKLPAHTLQFLYIIILWQVNKEGYKSRAGSGAGFCHHCLGLPSITHHSAKSPSNKGNACHLSQTTWSHSKSLSLRSISK